MAAKIKTWWDFYPMMALAAAIPIIAGILPTVQLNGVYWGGGRVRQFAINFVAERLPAEGAQKIVTAFMESNTLGEIMLYMPIALNLVVISVFIAYSLAYTIIEVSNFINRSRFDQQRSNAKN